MNGPHDARDEADEELPLADLQAAWRTLDAPPATAPLDAPDATTLATVEWLREAWQATATPPAPSVPWRLRARPLLRRASPWLALAAALLLFARTLAERPVAPLAIEPPVASRAVPRLDRPIARVTPDRMEMRSGHVRLILLTPPAMPLSRGPSPESAQ